MDTNNEIVVALDDLIHKAEAKRYALLAEADAVSGLIDRLTKERDSLLGVSVVNVACGVKAEMAASAIPAKAVRDPQLGGRIEAVLKQAGKPMRVAEIAEAVRTDEPDDRVFAAKVSATLLRRVNQPQSSIIKLQRGLFVHRNHYKEPSLGTQLTIHSHDTVSK